MALAAVRGAREAAEVEIEAGVREEAAAVAFLATKAIKEEEAAASEAFLVVIKEEAVASEAYLAIKTKAEDPEEEVAAEDQAIMAKAAQTPNMALE